MYFYIFLLTPLTVTCSTAVQMFSVVFLCFLCSMMDFHFVCFRVQYTPPLVLGDLSLSRLDTAFTALCNPETSKSIQYCALLWFANDSISAGRVKILVYTCWLRLFHNNIFFSVFTGGCGFRLVNVNGSNWAITTHWSFTYKRTKCPGTLKYFTLICRCYVCGIWFERAI